MTVRYITVTPVSKLFKPATRSFGDIAIVGAADTDAAGPMKTPIPITNPDSLTYSTRTTLANAVDATGTSLTVSPSTTGFPSSVPFSIKIDNEVLSVTAVNANTWTVTRGHAGTTAATTVLASAIVDAAVTSLTVSPSTTGFPSSMPFSIKIDNEVLSVTAVNANTWTVTRGHAGTTAATTVLASAIVDAAVTSLTVSPSTTGFPSSMPFSIKIDNEVLSVTAVNANTWTV